MSWSLSPPKPSPAPTTLPGAESIEDLMRVLVRQLRDHPLEAPEAADAALAEVGDEEGAIAKALPVIEELVAASEGDVCVEYSAADAPPRDSE